MNLFRLIYRSLIYYKRKNISLVSGAALSATILIGALIIGDSVKYSLDKIVLNRLGKIQFTLITGDRVFRPALADELSRSTNLYCSALLHTTGIVIQDGGQNRVNNIQIYGIDKNFDGFSPVTGIYTNLSPNEVIINSHLAEKLNVNKGDEILLRFEKLSSMPKDSPLSGDEDITVASRFKIKFIADDDKFGRFSIKAEQIAPFNVFLSMDKLSSLMGIKDAANILAVGSPNEKIMDLQQLNKKLNEVWTPEDSGLKLIKADGSNNIELRSNRIFLDNQVINTAEATGIKSSQIITYLVNEIKSGNNITPYSFVSGIGADLLGTELQSDQIIINEWAAKDLGAKTGSKINLKYFVVGENKKLVVDSSSFTISGIVKMNGIFADKTLLPDFPGLSETESCMDWHPGIPIDFKKVRDKDEKYWKEFKGTPKAFISLEKAKEIWGNRFGSLTAIRFLTDDSVSTYNKISENIKPADWNIQFYDTKTEGLEASSQSVDFGGLFLGLSFFIIISALLLTGLMFLFNLESRNFETGLFSGLGFNNNLIKKIIYYETGFLIITGSLIGCFTAVFYNKIILLALSTVWSDAVGTSSLEIFINPVTIITGVMIVIAMNLIITWWNIRQSFRKNIHSLQRGIVNLNPDKRKRALTGLILSLILFLTVICLIIFTDPVRGSEVYGLYFFNGVLLLTAIIILTKYFLGKEYGRNNLVQISIFQLALKELRRKKSRSLVLITLLASSLFIVFTVGINKKTVNENNLTNKSGTGGFTFYGETSVPLYEDLNNPEFRKQSGLDQFNTEDLKFIQFKVKAGEDASCLNLNRVKNPQIIAVDPDNFNKTESFSFSALSEYADDKNPWLSLNKKFGKNVIAGIADASVIQWQLGKSVGDTLIYTDDSGKQLFIILVAGLENSIFQGNLLISKSEFLEKFPSINGTKIFTAYSGTNKLNEIKEKLNYSLQDYGLNMSPAAERLAVFNKIENTYLSIFLILGSFGILIGSLGIGIVVYRNIAEQKKEYALLQAVGISKKQILGIIRTSYLIILLIGFLTGIIASVVASLPTLVTTNSEVPVLLMIVIILLIFVSGLISIRLAAGRALNNNIINLLKNE